MKEIISCNDNWMFSRDNVNWETVTFPHSAWLEPEEIFHPQTGVVYYRYEFDAPEDWRNKNPYFELGPAMQTARIYINGVYQFTHFGGYLKFFVPLADVVKFGEKNVLSIELDNNPSFDMPPGKELPNLDFLYPGGFYGSARLIVYDNLHISDPLAVSIPAGGGVFIRPETINKDVAFYAVSCHVMNEVPPEQRFTLREEDYAAKNLDLEVKFYSPCGGCVFAAHRKLPELRPNCDHTFEFGAAIEYPRFWSPETPILYRAEFKLYADGVQYDSWTERFGIRTIECTRDGFYLNGEKIFLNGTNRHSEFPFVGNSAGKAMQRRDALLIKKNGFNFVRLSHYNQSPDFLDACDELGLMVMPAIPGWQAYRANSAFINNAFRDCRELVRSLRNRPSIMIWEVSLNEAYPPGWINAEFHRIAHEEYPGPYCFTGGDTWGLYEGWDVLFPCEHMRSKDKPLLFREYGDWQFGGNKSTSRQRRGAAMRNRLVQTWNFLWNLNDIRKVDGVIGACDWCFFDYNRGCARTDGMERSGSYDLYRLPKLKAHFYRSQGCKESMVYAVHDGVSKVIVFSNCEEVELVRGEDVIKRQKPDSGPDTAYDIDNQQSPGWETAVAENQATGGGDPFDGGNALHLDHPPFTFFDIAPLKDGEKITLRGYKNGEVAATFELKNPGPAVTLSTEIREDGVKSRIGDLVFADAVFRDADGNVAALEDSAVEFTVSGSAELIGAMEKAEAGIASALVRVLGSHFEVKAACKYL